MKKGFVLVETITVITVLCIVLVLLYASYNNIIIKVESNSYYDNTEYIYKADILRDYLLEKNSIELYDDYNISYCQNTDETHKCYYEGCNNDECNLMEFLNIEAVYITTWDTKNLYKSLQKTNIDATTQKYIKSIDPEDSLDGTKRLIVMFKDINGSSMLPEYQYASLKIRGEQ